MVRDRHRRLDRRLCGCDSAGGEVTLAPNRPVKNFPYPFRRSTSSVRKARPTPPSGGPLLSMTD